MRIFLSYAREDSDFVNDLADILKKAGHDSFYDASIQGGDKWEIIIEDEIGLSDAFVFVITEQSLNSEWGQLEFSLARRYEKPIIPIMLEDVEYSSELGDYRYLDFRKRFTDENIALLMSVLDGINSAAVKGGFSETDSPPGAPSSRTPSQLPSHIYIAYSRDGYNTGIVSELISRLRENGYEPWIYYEQYENSSQWREDYPRAIAAASLMIIVVSERSMQTSSWAYEETALARSVGTIIIPVIAIKTELSDILRDLVPVDLSGLQPDWNALFERLAGYPIEIETFTQHGAINDLVSQEDQLEFRHYVLALADLITSPDTKPPLTIGIFGTWGMGKSFLLEHVQRKIRGEFPYGPKPAEEIPRRSSQPFKWWRPVSKVYALGRWLWRRWRRSGRRTMHHIREVVNAARSFVLRIGFDVVDSESEEAVGNQAMVEIVNFNAWEYSTTDVIWPGLVRKIMDTVEDEVGIVVRLQARIRRNVRIQQWYTPLLFLLLMSALGVVIFFNSFPELQVSEEVSRGLTLVGLVGIVSSIYKIISDVVANPLGQWITTLFEKNDYGKQIGFMEDIHDDLALLNKELIKRNKRVLVIVDDLDRCEPDKAVQMLQAIKLLLDFPSFIVIMGIDARIITKAVEKHYENLLGPAGASGYEYLDKIVQIPFRIPEPTKLEIGNFIRRQMTSDTIVRESTLASGVSVHDTSTPLNAEPGRTGDRVQAADGSTRPSSTPGNGSTEPPPPSLASKKIKQRQPVTFSDPERAAFQKLSHLLKPNPRHIKRLINVYRFNKSLAENRDEPFSETDQLKVIHWVVMCGQWPYTMHSMMKLFGELLEDEFEMQQQMILQESNNLGRLSDTQIANIKEKHFPFDCNPLLHLYDMVKRQLVPEKRNRLDYDADRLLWLIKHPEVVFSWDEVNKLRQYTVNFNPAVEAEQTHIIVPQAPVSPTEISHRWEYMAGDGLTFI